MHESDPKRVTRDALLALFAGLSLAACQKTDGATAEKPRDPAAAASVKAAVSAQELPKPAGSAAPEGSCAPGGCSPGACAGSKKK